MWQLEKKKHVAIDVLTVEEGRRKYNDVAKDDGNVCDAILCCDVRTIGSGIRQRLNHGKIKLCMPLNW